MSAPGPLVRYGSSDYGPYFYGYLTYSTRRHGVHTAPIGSVFTPAHAIDEVIRIDMVDPATITPDEAAMLLTWFQRVSGGFTGSVPVGAFDAPLDALRSALRRSEALSRQVSFLLEAHPPQANVDPAGVIDIASPEA